MQSPSAVSHSSPSEESGANALVYRLAEHERRFWLAAIIWYGFGDTATTLFGLTYADVAEVGPIAAPMLETYGLLALLILKVAFFAAAGIAWYGISRPTRVGIPIAITIVGTAVTVWNAFVILLSFS